MQLWNVLILWYSKTIERVQNYGFCVNFRDVKQQNRSKFESNKDKEESRNDENKHNFSISKYKNQDVTNNYENREANYADDGSVVSTSGVSTLSID